MLAAEGRTSGLGALPVFLALLAFALTAYGPALNIPFIGDDYVFLDKTRTARFAELWSLSNTNFGWYRPWSREMHFWTLQHVAGAREIAFRGVSLTLWLAGFVLFGRFLSGFLTRRGVAIAVLGAGSLALWGAPLMWISGSQDLWMIVFALGALLAHARSRTGWALACLALALLSKETAVMIPGIVIAHDLLVLRLPPKSIARRVWPYVAMGLIWFFAHPVLSHRLFEPEHATPMAERPIHPALVLFNAVLATANADRILAIPDPAAFSIWQTLASSFALCAGMWLAVRNTGPLESASPSLPPRASVMGFGAAWAAVGWVPLFHPSIGWHAYYACLGVLGAWVLLASLLERCGRATLVAVIAVLGLLRGASAAVKSWDWGSEWYQRRAGNMLELIHSQLTHQYPSLPPHTRVYFGNIPNNIGLVAGESPAIRVWYSDETLEAGFYSYYRPRPAPEPIGRDLFFHFDSTYGIREVVAGEEKVAEAAARDATWERNHESLAMLLLQNGDPALASAQFEKISQLPHRPDALMFAGVCHELAGDSLAARESFRRAQARFQVAPEEISAWANRLREARPRQ